MTKKTYSVSLRKLRELLDQPALGIERIPGFIPEIYAAMGLDDDDLVSVKMPGLRRRMIYDRSGNVTRKFPTKREMAGNLTAAGARIAARVLSGKKVIVPEEVFEQRMSECKSCDFFDLKSKRCKLCGCKTQKKLRLAGESCPHPTEPRWGAWDDG